MATKDTTPTTTPESTQPVATPGVDYERMGEVIGNAVSQGIAANTRRKITIGEYNARGGNSAFHPNSPTLTPKLKRTCYSNGHRIDESTTFDAEIDLLNQITHSGRYIDRLVEVVVSEDGSDEVVDIRFSNKSQYAFELKGKARNFEEMLKQIVEAQRLEREEAEELANNRSNRRHFGAGKASREARGEK